MASVYGIDPVLYLRLDAHDRQIINAVIRQRGQIDADSTRDRLDYVASKTAQNTAQAITRWLGKNLPKMFGRR